MKRLSILIGILALCSLALNAQTAVWVRMWMAPGTSGAPPQMQWVQLGPGLSVVNGVLTVTVAPTSNRVYETVLSVNASGQYPLPVATATNVSVWVNGLRYYRPRDFNIVSGAIVPTCTPGQVTCNWPPPAAGTVVLIDYDK